jgi:hypothetical protein
VISTRLTGRAYAAATHSTCPELTSESTAARHSKWFCVSV